MAWLFLGAAIAFEVAATSLLKSTAGFTRLGPTLACLAGYAGSFYLLSLALRQLQVGVAYAIWSGLGTAAIAVIGALFLAEPITVAKVTGIVLIIAGVVILNVAGAH
ncbi:multidrug efflux SMR transporter [Solwaraspora sp. WMMD1047]|uniref:DMT family transporter n=1 Tax=Solwaraspora sp. WMMD1047 TaxID=3016102 RepID=UPI002417AC8F|nr:multidrug efflux SMR transporter [Solwaraspora sp. WMMD1047]MDG4830855.1 multidrug efflux SMR transporter [Solwaraspora sp. WMMD1047]